MKLIGIVVHLCYVTIFHGELVDAGEPIESCPKNLDRSIGANNVENIANLIESLTLKVNELEAFKTFATFTFTKLINQVEHLEKQHEQQNHENRALINEKEEKIKELEETNSMFKERLEKLEKTEESITVSKNQEEVNQWLWKLTARRSCHELAHFGIKKSGVYYLDPDGRENNNPPVEISCKFSSEESASTIFHNINDLTNVKRCSDPHCDVVSVEYGASLEQIVALINLSDSCRQTVTYNCYLAPLSRNGQDYAGWKDRNGAGHSFCGNGVVCACDDFLPENLTDVFEIKDKSKLPITSVSFGGLKVPGQNASYFVSELQCTSGFTHDTPETSSSSWGTQKETCDGLGRCADRDAAIIVGGLPSTSTFVGTVELWSPNGICNTVLKGELRDHRYTSTNFVNGEIVTCVGEQRNQDNRRICRSLDFNSEEWNEYSTLKYNRVHHSSVVMDQEHGSPHETLFIIGGGSGDDWQKKPSLSTSILSLPVSKELPRFGAYEFEKGCIVKTTSDTFVVLGGTKNGGKQVRQFNIENQVITALPNLPDARHSFGCSYVDTPEVKGIIVAGGRVGTNYHDYDKQMTGQFYNIYTKMWTSTGKFKYSHDEGSKMVSIQDRYFLLGGGNQKVEEFLPSSMSWQQGLSDLKAARGGSQTDPGVAAVPSHLFSSCSS